MHIGTTLPLPLSLSLLPLLLCEGTSTHEPPLRHGQKRAVVDFGAVTGCDVVVGTS
jgi:hypothetical protein